VGLRPCEVSSFFKAREKTLLDKRALTFLENCERYTLRSLVRRSAKHHAEVTVDHVLILRRACGSSLSGKARRNTGISGGEAEPIDARHGRVALLERGVAAVDRPV